MNEKHEISYPCDKCEKLGVDGGCVNIKRCPMWRAWFSQEWKKIQKTYEGVKKT